MCVCVYIYINNTFVYSRKLSYCRNTKHYAIRRLCSRSKRYFDVRRSRRRHRRPLKLATEDTANVVAFDISISSVSLGVSPPKTYAGTPSCP